MILENFNVESVGIANFRYWYIAENISLKFDISPAVRSMPVSAYGERLARLGMTSSCILGFPHFPDAWSYSIPKHARQCVERMRCTWALFPRGYWLCGNIFDESDFWQRCEHNIASSNSSMLPQVCTRRKSLPPANFVCFRTWLKKKIQLESICKQR